MLQPDQRNEIGWLAAMHEHHQLQLLELWKWRGGMLERGIDSIKEKQNLTRRDLSSPQETNSRLRSRCCKDLIQQGHAAKEILYHIYGAQVEEGQWWT